MTGKEERTKTEEMKNADKQGAETGHHGPPVKPGTSEYQTDLTPQTAHTGCSQLRQIKYLSDDENNVRRRPSTNNNIKHQQQSQIFPDLSTI